MIDQLYIMMPKPDITFTYGLLGKVYKCVTQDHLIAYATMILHAGLEVDHLIIISPDEYVEDNWTTFFGGSDSAISDLFGGSTQMVDKFIRTNIKDIIACYQTIGNTGEKIPVTEVFDNYENEIALTETGEVVQKTLIDPNMRQKEYSMPVEIFDKVKDEPGQKHDESEPKKRRAGNKGK